MRYLSATHAPPETKRALMILGVLGILLPLFVATTGGDHWMRILDFALLYVMLAVGLNVVVGFAGLLDLGYIAFYALGAYSMALLGSPHLAGQFAALADSAASGLHVSLWLVIPIAALLAGVLGMLLGAPTLKLRGDYLAIVTLGFGEIIRIFLNNLDRPLNITNGPKGVSGIDPISVFGMDISSGVHFAGTTISPVVAYYYVFLFLVVLQVAICLRLQYSRIGRAWVAIREDEIAAKAMGINTRNLKLLAFAMGACFGGVAGSLFGSFQGFVSPESFSLWQSVIVLCMVVLGGIGNIPGVIFGAIALTVFPELLRAFVEPLQMSAFGKVYIEPEIMREYLYGIALVLIVQFRPGGLWPAPRGEDRPIMATDIIVQN